jgi:tRNA (guanine9-N1)-methyltransferase
MDSIINSENCKIQIEQISCSTDLIIQETTEETEPKESTETNPITTRKRLNKKEKKLQKYKKLLENYKLKKEENKKLKKVTKETEEEIKQEEEPSKPKSNILYDVFYNKRELKKLMNERLAKVYEDNTNALKVCIDCSFSNRMSDKEMSRLAQQIGRCYASNKLLKTPIHLTLCNLDKESKFYAELVRVNDGFVNYKLLTTDKPLEQLYSNQLESLCYLSPDSKTYLENLDSTSTYVIGGLVDETVSKQVTLTKCTELKVKSFSLPIEKYMTRKINGLNGKSYNYNKILAINQVFDILASFYTEKDWPKALQCGIPPRCVFYF